MWKNLRNRLFQTKPNDADDLLKLHSKYKDVFGSTQGEDVLFHICKAAYVFDSTFVANDPHQTALNEGSRRLALSILRFIDRDFAQLHKLNETTTES